MVDHPGNSLMELHGVSPCPFCGLEPRVFLCKEHEKWNIYCLNAQCGVMPKIVDDQVSLQHAVQAWNERA